MFFGSQIQVFLFIYLYVGYLLYIFNRRSFGFMIPTISEKDEMSNDSIGTILSSLASAYAIGKFLSGLLVDRFSSRLMFSTGLFGVGLCNLLFSIASPAWFPILWFFNGLAQGPGWPACAKILRRWYSPSIFGTLWSALSTSSNVPASIGPLLCTAYIAANNGFWRPVMLICGTISCGYAFLVLFIVHDKPEDVGLTLEALQKGSSQQSLKCNDAVTKKPKLSNSQEVENNGKQKVASQKSNNVWLAIFTSFYTYVISMGFLLTLLLKGILSDWSPLYLIQVKGADEYLSGVFIAWLEIGGVVGSIFTGYVSDKIVQCVGPQPKGHPRHYMYIAWLLVIFVCLVILQQFEDVKSNLNIVLILSFLLGFCVYGNLSLCGVLTIENAGEDISGTAHACCALFGNVGLMMSGLPFSKLVGFVGWDKAFQISEVAILALAGLFMVSQKFSCYIGYKKKKR